MPDFPNIGLPPVTPTVICSLSSPEALGYELLTATTLTPTSSVLFQDTIYYVPFRLAAPMTARQMFIENGPALGSLTFSLGIYTEGGNRVVISASTPQSAVNSIQVVDITDTLLLPGRYYMAFVCFDPLATGTIVRSGPSLPVVQAMGVLIQASATLPVTATFAKTTIAQIPLIGITGSVTV